MLRTMLAGLVLSKVLTLKEAERIFENLEWQAEASDVKGVIKQINEAKKTK